MRGPANAFVVLCTALAFSSSAQAAPVHPFLPSSSLDGSTTPAKDFDKACGVATDSEGDVYVASANNSAIDVFDPVGKYLATIANANKPCGLAVDTKGRLYVSESATGKVVRYTPSAYPFAGAPSYGGPVTEDASGKARGIAVDPDDDRLYVAEGDHIAVYSSAGALETSIGVGKLSEATGVATYSYGSGEGSFKDRHVFAADAATDEIHAFGGTKLDALKLRWTIDGSETPDGSFGFGATGAYLAVDQASGHLLVYDAGHSVVDEFEADGQYLTQIEHPSFADAGPTAIAVHPALNEVQRVAVKDAGAAGAPKGSFTLSFGGEETEPIAYSADTTFARDVQAALEALGSIGPGNVVVGGIRGGPFTITFAGELGARNIAGQVEGDPSGLTGVAPEVTVQVTRQGSGPGAVYATSGASAGADVLAFGPLPAPSRTALAKPFPLPFKGPCGTATDSHGDIYVAGETTIKVFSPAGAELKKIIAAEKPCALAVDSEGNLFVSLRGDINARGDEKVVMYEPDSYPPTAATKYAGPTTLLEPGLESRPVVNPANDHLFVNRVAQFNGEGTPILEYSDPVAGTLESWNETQRVAVDATGGSFSLTVPTAVGHGLVEAGSVVVTEVSTASGAFHVGDKLTDAASVDATIVAVGTETLTLSAPLGGETGSIRSELTATETTAAIPYNASAGELEAALTSLPGGVGNVEVSGDSGANAPFAIEFTATLGDFNLAQIEADDSGLTGGGAGVTVETETDGYDGIIRGFDASDLDVCGKTGNVYVGDHRAARPSLAVLSAGGAVLLARIDGSGSPRESFVEPLMSGIAVDQSNCHVFVSESRRAIEEYDASGAFVAEFGPVVSESSAAVNDIAVDSPSPGQAGYDSPNQGNFYAAGVLGNLSAYGPLNYGEPPVATTGVATAVGGGGATLNGIVDPRSFEVEDCRFDYTDDDQFKVDGFASASSVPCAESPAAIGKGAGPVPVHAQLSGLETGGRYHFRLVAENEFGAGEGKAGLFGPPLLTAKPASQIAYSEASLNAIVDPSGLNTTYRFEYGTSASYGLSTPETTIAAGEDPTEIHVPLFGLQEGTTHHFRLVVSNEAETVEGLDQTFTTQARAGEQDCPNAELRTGRSANLPDCRAYELVTPADTRDAVPEAGEAVFDNWLVPPRGEFSGNAIGFTLYLAPGTDANAGTSQYEATREADGWASVSASPTVSQVGSAAVAPLGSSTDRGYSFWTIEYIDKASEESLAAGRYLRTPEGFGPLGLGELGSDLDIENRGRFISPGGGHVIFTSPARLEEAAPPKGVVAVYDRAPGGPTHVVSLLPGDETPAGNASYQGATEDGSSIVFKLGAGPGEKLYVRNDNTETLAIVPGPSSFAGISSDGERVFYAGTAPELFPPPADLFAFDVSTEASTEIAPNSHFVNVSADGSYVYFTSTDRLDDADAGVPGANNLYVWDGSSTRFIAVLDPKDLKEFRGSIFVNLARWGGAGVMWPDPDNVSGARENSPSRTSTDGRYLVFQSHANLTAYDSEGRSEIYRFDTVDGTLLCVSCTPSGARPVAGSELQNPQRGRTTDTTHIPNVTDDGSAVFFESGDALLPEDANSAWDVYEWVAPSAGDCERPGGCLHLISSGQAETDSSLYSMTPDGSDVFFTTAERLLSHDVIGGISIYDARVNGGFPEVGGEESCEGDACQGQASAPPGLPGAASAGFQGPGNVSPSRPRCRKGKRSVVRRGKARCVKQQQRKQQRQKHHRGRAAR